MNATAIRDRRQTTLPADVAKAAGLSPGDQIDWRFEDGEIRGRKLQPRIERSMSKTECIQAIRTSSLKFKVSWDQLKVETR